MISFNNCKFLIAVFFVILLFFLDCCCSKHSKDNPFGIMDIVTDTIFIRDTIYLDKEYSISDDLYFSINEIYNGDSWEKKDDADYNYYYRLLFASIEERYYLYMEEIKIIFDGKVKLIERFKVNPQVFGQDYYNYPLKLIDWISPQTVKLLVNEKEYNLDISKMKVVK